MEEKTLTEIELKMTRLIRSLEDAAELGVFAFVNENIDTVKTIKQEMLI